MKFMKSLASVVGFVLVMGVPGHASAATDLGLLDWGAVEALLDDTPEDYNFTLAHNAEVTFVVISDTAVTILGELTDPGGLVGFGTNFVVALDQGIAYKFRVTKNPSNQSGNTSFSGSISVSAVPLPAAAWLFGSALFGLVGVARRKKA